MAAPPKRITPPLVQQFHVAVDLQLKSGHATYEAAEKAALAIKKRYPQLRVTVYDAKEQRHTPILLPATAANPGRSSRRIMRTTARRPAVAGGKH